MKDILDAILAEAAPTETREKEFGALAVPESYRGMVVRKDETGMFEGLTSRDKDPRRSLHLDEVPTPRNNFV